MSSEFPSGPIFYLKAIKQILTIAAFSITIVFFSDQIWVKKYVYDRTDEKPKVVEMTTTTMRTTTTTLYPESYFEAIDMKATKYLEKSCEPHSEGLSITNINKITQESIPQMRYASIYLGKQMGGGLQLTGKKGSEYMEFHEKKNSLHE